MSDLKGWHRGEKIIQQKLNHASAVVHAFTWISGDMPEQHREFHTTRLPFVPLTTLDAEGRPWGSILAGNDGKPGFIRSPTDTTLTMDVRVWEGDPWLADAALFAPEKKMLAAGIGIEFPTRRRNKFAGWVSGLDQKGRNTFRLEMKVNQAIGNCPKYINIRDLVPYPTASPTIVCQQLHLQPTERLPEDIISFITEADTVFLGSSYVATPGDEHDYPSHVGMNQRAGLPGFVRVVPSDGRTVVLPDYSGNRLMTSLGNIEATPLASLTFVSFTTGAVLYLTGTARTLVGPAAHALMPRQNTLTAIHTTGAVFVHDALPVRQRPDTPVARSPYSPPIRRLAEEAPALVAFADAGAPAVLLTRIERHSASLATFTWEAAQPVRITPGQAAILDFSPFVGASEYAHMAPDNPAAVNDDHVRTWTMSSAHPPEGARAFRLTMRAKPGGLVTGALFAVAGRLAEARPELLADMRALGVRVQLVGIQGDFVLPPGAGARLLWVAGGIGVTPFLSMLAAIAGAPAGAWDVVLVLATREPAVLLPLLEQAMRGMPAGRLRLALHVFSDSPVPGVDCADVVLRRHAGRMPAGFFGEWAEIDAGAREAYVCGPEAFERTVVDALGRVGVPSGSVRREGFAY